MTLKYMGDPHEDGWGRPHRSGVDGTIIAHALFNIRSKVVARVEDGVPYVEVRIHFVLSLRECEICILGGFRAFGASI